MGSLHHLCGKAEEVDRMETKDRRANNRIQEKGVGEERRPDLAALQKAIEIATGTVAHHTKAERVKITQSTPENVRLREEAAARCTASIKRKVLKKQARKARAGCFEPGKKKTKRKPLSELYVKGHFIADREEQQELQRHCQEVYTDKEETKESQQNRVSYFEEKRDQHFTEEGRFAEITLDLVF